MKNKTAFSLIEIMVAIGIIMLMAAISVPAYRNFFPKATRRSFIADLNALAGLAWRSAITTNTTSILFFDFKNRTITAGKLTGKKEEKGKHEEPAWTPVRGTFIKNRITIPVEYRFVEFSIESINELEKIKRDYIWFFITPNGISQRIQISFIDTKETKRARKERITTLRINPFNAQFQETK